MLQKVGFGRGTPLEEGRRYATLFDLELRHQNKQVGLHYDSKRFVFVARIEKKSFVRMGTTHNPCKYLGHENAGILRMNSHHGKIFCACSSFFCPLIRVASSSLRIPRGIGTYQKGPEYIFFPFFKIGFVLIIDGYMLKHSFSSSLAENKMP